METKEKILHLLNLGYSYRGLGKICGVHHSSLANWCQKDIDLSPRLIQKIEDGLKEHLKILKQILE